MLCCVAGAVLMAVVVGTIRFVRTSLLRRTAEVEAAAWRLPPPRRDVAAGPRAE